MHFKFFACAGAVLALSACTPTETRGGVKHYIVPGEIKAAYLAAPSCCKSFSEFAYTPLGMDTSAEYKLDVSAQAFEFETGKSFFRAFALPDTDGAFDVTITSHFPPIKTYVFYPEALILDRDFKPVRRVDYRNFPYSGVRMFGAPYFQGKLSFAPSATARAEKYIVVLTTPQLMNNGLPHRESGFGYMAGTTFVMMPGANEVYDFGPVAPDGLTIAVAQKG